MLKITINNEEVVSNKDFTIEEEMLNTSSVILNNVYPKSWENDKDYVSRFYHPNDYSKCLIKDEDYTPAEPGLNEEGTNFQITADTTKQYELTSMKGNTTQSSTPTPTTPVPVNVVSGRQDVMVIGKNLFNASLIGNYTSQGVNVSQQGQEVILSGTPTRAWGSTPKKQLPQTLRAGETYYFSSNSRVPIKLWFYASTTTATIVSNVAYNTSFTPSEDINAFVFVFEGLTVGQTYNETLTIQVEKGSATEYEAYKENTYEINLGKNLLDYQYSNLNNITRSTASEEENGFKLTSTGASGYGYGALTLDNSLLGQTITISMTSSGNKTPSGRLFYVRDNNTIGTNVGAFWTTNNSHTETLPSTLPSGSKAIALVLYISQGNNASGDYAIFQNIQVEKGSSASSYAEYKPPIELCKIGNYQDRIFKSSGKNLFDNTYNDLGMWITNIGETTTFAQGSQYLGAYCKVEPGTYTISRNKKTNRFRIGVSPNQPTGTTSSCYVVASNDNASSITIDVPQGNNYICIYLSNNSETSTNVDLMINKGTTALPYEPYGTGWFINKQIGKVVMNGTENWGKSSSTANTLFYLSNTTPYKNGTTRSSTDLYCNYFEGKIVWGNNVIGCELYVNNSIRFGLTTSSTITTLEQWKTWLSNNNTTVYYVLATPTTTEITDTELISQLESIELLEGLNNVSVVSPYLQGIINLHYNFVNEETTSNLLFCGVVKNSGNISLNPRYPHYQSLQILDFKTFLSEGETLDFVIANKTIEEAIDQIISTISPYGFVKGNIQIIGAGTIIGAYSTKDKTAYDVFNYLADITQSRWTTRMIDENTVAVDFYDPTLLPQGTPINYNETWFRNNLIDDMTYSYGSNDYRNKQVMTSNEVYGSILQTQTMVANGYRTQFDTELKIGQITSITANGTQLTIATNKQKELGFNADIYYTPGNNYFESADLRSTGEILIVNYIAIVEGRQIITNGTEINRVATATGRKGIVARYENRNDANTSNELQLIGQSYIRYKGTPEIKLTIVSRKNLWNIGDRVQFNAPINELATEYMVKKKTINRILANPSSEEHIVYTYEMTSSFNSEQAINYFDNQRAKAKGNIGESEYITRNVDIENIANIIFYGSNVEQATITGDNTLQATLSSPIIN